MKTCKRKTAGFTLIEVLISILVLSVGLLGLAGMQVVGLRNSSSSTFRSQAAAIATDMAERMRANRKAIDDDNVDLNGDGLINASDDMGLFDNVDSLTLCSGDVPTNCDSEICTPEQVARFDQYAVACGVLGGVNTRLPNGHLTVHCAAPPCADNVPYEIKVEWDELQGKVGTGASTTQTKNVTMSIVP